ncbi:MAG TPA: cell division protein ZapA [Bacilli bacterium]
MGSDDKNRITLDIYGTPYKFVGQSSTNHIRLVAAQVSEQMHKMAVNFPQLDTTRLAVLTAVNMADENFKLKQEWEEERKARQNNQELAQYRKLQSDHEQLKNEYRISMERVEGHKQKEQSLMDDYRKLLEEHESLKTEYQEAKERFESDKHGEHSIHENFRKLQEEYKKLQNEYNEWIELSERDQPRHN